MQVPVNVEMPPEQVWDVFMFVVKYCEEHKTCSDCKFQEKCKPLHFSPAHVLNGESL